MRPAPPERIPGPDGVVRLVLPSTLLSTGVLAGLREALTTFAEGPAPLVLESPHPRIFLAGADLREIAALTRDTAGPYADEGRRTLRALERHPAPVVAAVGGACTGGGLDLALACDAVVAGPRAAFAHPGVRRGLVTGWSGTARLPRLAGRHGAARILLEGAFLGPHEAQREGLVALVDPDPVGAGIRESARLARLDPRRLLLWRTLRSSRFIDRFRGCVVHNWWRQHPSRNGERP